MSSETTTQVMARYLDAVALRTEASMINLAVAGGAAVVEADFTSTHADESMGTPPTGKKVRVPCAWSTRCRTTLSPGRMSTSSPLRSGSNRTGRA